MPARFAGSAMSQSAGKWEFGALHLAPRGRCTFIIQKYLLNKQTPLNDNIHNTRYVRVCNCFMNKFAMTNCTFC